MKSPRLTTNLGGNTASGMRYWQLAGTSMVLLACSATSKGGSAGAGAGTSSSGNGGGLAEGGGLQASGGAPNNPGVSTCEEAAKARSYVGCEFYPVVTPNLVDSVFDFAVVVANASDEPTEATVTRGGTTYGQVTIGPKSAERIFLPWVPELDVIDPGGIFDPPSLSGSVQVAGGAYALTTTRPVTVYQFNPLEYSAQGGPPGKNWSSCVIQLGADGCYSYSNDASLLIPATAMSENYRVLGYPGDTTIGFGPIVSIVATTAATDVTVRLSSTSQLLAGSGLGNEGPGATFTFSLNQGDVMQLAGSASSDFSGSLIQSNEGHPIQVISAHPCTDIPTNKDACDHLEETVLPAESLGKHYFVASPTGPYAGDVPYVVRFYGNVDDTTLTYAAAPAGAPTTLGAGQTVTIGPLTGNFEVTGSNEFGVGLFQVSAELIDSQGAKEGLGDPAQSSAVAVEQYRTEYIFLAPTDYIVSVVDIISPVGNTLSLDGEPVNVAGQAIGESGFEVVRVPLVSTGVGAHHLTAKLPVGIQVIGYGLYTSYQYPGGSDLVFIAPPPK